MKIIYCIAGTRHSGGMERVLANKANFLAEHGYNIIIVTTDQCGEPSFFPLDNRIRCIDLNINYEENNGKSIWNKLVHYPIKQIKHKNRLTTLLKKEKPDITISMYCNDAQFLPSIHDGSKKILEIHFSRFKRLQYGRKGLWKLADRFRSHQDASIVKKYDKFVVLTNEDKSYWGNLKNICVIPNARTFTFSSLTPLDNKEVIAVGRYCFQKGFDILIDAWYIVCKKNADWILRIVGNGEQHEELQRKINIYGIGERVILDNSRPNMISIYQKASLFVLSSRYEGLPMVLLEAQSAGLPVVSFTCKCGPKDLIEDGISGFLVSEGDVIELANKILRLMEDKKLRESMGKAAFINSRKYSMEHVMQQWIDLFGNLTQK